MGKAKRQRTAETTEKGLRDGESFPIYRPHELAEMLGVKITTLREWRKTGKGPPFIRESPRSCVYLRSSVEKWLRSHERTVQNTYKLKRTKGKQGSNDAQPAA